MNKISAAESVCVIIEPDCDWLAPSKPLPRQPLPFPRSAVRNRADARTRTTDGDADLARRVRWRKEPRVFPQRA